VDFSLLYIGKLKIIVTNYAVTAYQLKQTLRKINQSNIKRLIDD